MTMMLSDNNARQISLKLSKNGAKLILKGFSKYAHEQKYFQKCFSGFLITGKSVIRLLSLVGTHLPLET